MRGFIALSLLASLAAVLATGAPASAAGSKLTIHKFWCSSEAKNFYKECHNSDHAYADVGFTVKRYSNGATVGSGTTNGAGVYSLAVPATKIKIVEDAADITDGGQYIYCSSGSKKSHRVLYNNTRTGGVIAITVRAGEKVVCDWYNLVRPQPQGVTLNIHAFWCPAKTKGDIYKACHNSRHAKEGVEFGAVAGGDPEFGVINAQGRLTLDLETTTTGKVTVTVFEEEDAITDKGAFVYCTVGGHTKKGSAVVFSGTVDDGEVSFKVKDGSTVTCDWYNLEK